MLSICLSSCALQQAPLIDGQTKLPSKPLNAAQITTWRLKGRVAIKQGQEGFNASLYWHQSGPQQISLTLSGPLGSGMVRLVQRGHDVTLIEGKKQWRSHDPDQLLAAHTGYHLPIVALYYWIRGLPIPNQAHDASTDKHRLKQLGWQILFQRTRSIDGIQLPDKITMTQGDLKIKLIVQSWSL